MRDASVPQNLLCLIRRAQCLLQAFRQLLFKNGSSRSSATHLQCPPIPCPMTLSPTCGLYAPGDADPHTTSRASARYLRGPAALDRPPVWFRSLEEGPCRLDPNDQRATVPRRSAKPPTCSSPQPLPLFYFACGPDDRVDLRTTAQVIPHFTGACRKAKIALGSHLRPPPGRPPQPAPLHPVSYWTSGAPVEVQARCRPPSIPITGARTAGAQPPSCTTKPPRSAMAGTSPTCTAAVWNVSTAGARCLPRLRSLRRNPWRSVHRWTGSVIPPGALEG